ncbi:MAG TPA: hypothetical protein PKI20_05925 [Verrucomicrobiota bacterium]|nr:hypothetical protein [Verrucomicrobiota bacterium]HQL77172.1 hypothetical protein [Verrucomicrobiota bacterium]
MHTALPYRPPCAGWRPALGPGGCFQHWRRREAYFPVYSNDTKDTSNNVPAARVAAWASKVDGELVVDRADCATGSGKKEVSYNCLTLMPDRTKNLAHCLKVGWKGVQARKFWHGRVPFTSWEDGDCTTTEVDATAPGTRYLAFTKEMSWEVQSYVCLDGGNGVTKVTAGSSYQRTTTIGRTTGLATSSNCEKSWSESYEGSSSVCPDRSGENDSSEEWEPLQSKHPDGPPMPDQVCGGYFVGMQDFIDWLEIGWVINTGRAAALAQQGATIATYTLSCSPKPPNTFDISLVVSVTLTLSTAYDAAALRSDLAELLAEWDLTDDAVYPWRYDMALTTCPLVTRNEVEQARSPEFIFTELDDCDEIDPILADPLASYIDGSIRGAPFEDGYPAVFSEDTVAEDFDSEDIEESAIQLSVTAQHLDSVEGFDADDVSRGAGTEGVDYTFDADCQKVELTPNGPGYTNPLLPVNAGDYITVTYDRQNDDTGGLFNFFYEHPTTHLYGQWSAGSIPHSATQWTPDDKISSLPPGAWLKVMDGGALWGQKYAEIKNPWHSLDWFGPSGARREDVVDTDPRWPNAWPIDGDRGCTFEEGSGTVTVTLDSAAQYLAVGDLVDFTTADGLTVDSNSGSGYEVASIGSGTFTYAGAAPGATYTRVKSHGAPGFWWHDTDGKGDFLKNEWRFNYRDVSSALDPDKEVRAAQLLYYGMPREVINYTCQTKCLAFSRCSPSVMCFSPNAEVDDFEHGATYDFDEEGEFVPDVKFGALWIGTFRQIMDDLWFTADPEDVEDDGGCGSTVKDPTAPHRMVVEARATVPAAWISGDAGPAPGTYYTTDIGDPVGFTLRDGQYRLFLELEDMQFDGNDGIVQLPIDDMLDPIGEPWMPWRLWTALRTCICSEGIFADDYEDILTAWICGADPTICSGHYPA